MSKKGNPGDALDLNMLMEPASAFRDPVNVVRDMDLTLNEKRAILAAWASRVCAREAVPELHDRSFRQRVTFEDIVDAMRVLDSSEGQTLKKYQKIVRRRDRFLRIRSRADNKRTAYN